MSSLAALRRVGASLDWSRERVGDRVGGKSSRRGRGVVPGAGGAVGRD